MRRLATLVIALLLSATSCATPPTESREQVLTLVESDADHLLADGVRLAVYGAPLDGSIHVPHRRIVLTRDGELVPLVEVREFEEWIGDVRSTEDALRLSDLLHQLSDLHPTIGRVPHPLDFELKPSAPSVRVEGDSFVVERVVDLPVDDDRVAATRVRERVHRDGAVEFEIVERVAEPRPRPIPLWLE